MPPPSAATVVQQWPPAPSSAKSSPRMLGYAVPLQPIHPTATLSAAVATMPASAAPGSTGAGDIGSASNSTLQLYVSLLTRFPFLVRELAAEELWEQDAIDLEAVERWAQSKSSAKTALGAAAGTAVNAGEGMAEFSGGGSWADSSRADSRDGPAGAECCVVSQPPCMLMGRPDVNSLGAYLERTKLQQVRGANTHGVRAGVGAMQGLVQCDRLTTRATSRGRIARPPKNIREYHTSRGPAGAGAIQSVLGDSTPTWQDWVARCGGYVKTPGRSPSRIVSLVACGSFVEVCCAVLSVQVAAFKGQLSSTSQAAAAAAAAESRTRQEAVAAAKALSSHTDQEDDGGCKCSVHDCGRTGG
jgi:hypothetical protein